MHLIKTLKIMRRSILAPLLYILSSISPKQKKKIIFGAWFGQQYTDSPRYIFEHARKRPDWNAIWITKSQKVFEELKEQDYRVFLAGSLAGIYHQITAKTFIICVNSRDVNEFTVSPRTKLIQLNHGMPIKGFFSERFTRLQKIKNYLRQKTIDNYFLIASAHEAFDKLISVQWNVDISHIIKMPMARCDAMALSEREISDVKKSIDLPEKKIVIYAPTHRDEGRTIDRILEVTQLLSQLFEEKQFDEYQLVIKPHFYDYGFKSQLESISPNIRVITDEIEVNALLAISEVLVGDYSGIVFDYTYLRKPVIGFCPDLIEYLSRHRSLYFLPDEIYNLHPKNEMELRAAFTSAFNEEDRSKQWVKIDLNDENSQVGTLSQTSFDMITSKL
jgi:CDP-glycerol glycerophosphotransferase (TagB/SpsB family)